MGTIVLTGASSGSATLQSTDATTTTITLPSTTGTLVTTATQTLSKSFTSSNQSIPTASGQTFTVAHSMGVVPKILRLVAVCLTAQYGWTVGAEGDILVNSTTNGNIQMVPVLADATNVYYVAGSYIGIPNFSTGDIAGILNNSNFALKIYAYA